MANPLKNFSDDRLLEELVRRRNVRADRDERMPLKLCDECRHFDAKEVRRDVWECKKGHQMKFRMPEGGDPKPGEWGFYRRVCPDRAPADQITAESETESR